MLAPPSAAQSLSQIYKNRTPLKAETSALIYFQDKEASDEQCDEHGHAHGFAYTEDLTPPFAQEAAVLKVRAAENLGIHETRIE